MKFWSPKALLLDSKKDFTKERIGLMKLKDAEVVQDQARWLGRRVKRREDPHLLTGASRYLADLVRPGILHAAFLRSPYAHARIRAMDASRARSMPGVQAVLTGADL